jgi:hypothetical protein
MAVKVETLVWWLTILAQLGCIALLKARALTRQ